MLNELYFIKVLAKFDGNYDKTWNWFKSRHSAFGMFSPLAMIKLNKEEKVKKFIDSGEFE